MALIGRHHEAKASGSWESNSVDNPASRFRACGHGGDGAGRQARHGRWAS